MCMFYINVANTDGVKSYFLRIRSNVELFQTAKHSNNKCHV